MITVASPEQPLDRALLASRGGFAWWYVDLVNDEGDGVVLIAAFGLPFLPGYAASARRGEAPEAGERPSLNVVVYRGGEPVFYLLQEYDEQEAAWTDDEVRLGRSTLRTSLEDGRRVLKVTLDADLPSATSRLHGTLEVSGPAVVHAGPSDPSASVHRWTPLTAACPGTAILHVGDELLIELTARAYHDRNGCPVPLHDLGIAHWIWGRTPFEGYELVHYLLWPEGGGEPRGIVVKIDEQGVAERFDDVVVVLHGPQRGWFGLRWWRSLTLSAPGLPPVTVRHTGLVDDGFFYLRFLTEVQHGDVVAIGVGEAVVPDRVDVGWQRPLVQMAVHHTKSANSVWQPLFVGLRRGRWARLFGRS